MSKAVWLLLIIIVLMGASFLPGALKNKYKEAILGDWVPSGKHVPVQTESSKGWSYVAFDADGEVWFQKVATHTDSDFINTFEYEDIRSWSIDRKGEIRTSPDDRGDFFTGTIRKVGDGYELQFADSSVIYHKRKQK